MTARSTDTVELRFTTAQQRRFRWGLLGIAAIVWSAGVVRFTLVDRLSRPSGWLALAVLGGLLAGLGWVLGSVRPVAGLDGDGLAWRWGPRQGRVSWADVAGVELVERGTARRVVLTRHDGGRERLPVPLTGGSLVGPGRDPDLDDKVDLIRRWWVDHRPT